MYTFLLSTCCYYLLIIQESYSICKHHHHIIPVGVSSWAVLAAASPCTASLLAASSGSDLDTSSVRDVSGFGETLGVAVVEDMLDEDCD